MLGRQRSGALLTPHDNFFKRDTSDSTLYIYWLAYVCAGEVISLFYLCKQGVGVSIPPSSTPNLAARVNN